MLRAYDNVLEYRELYAKVWCIQGYNEFVHKLTHYNWVSHEGITNIKPWCRINEKFWWKFGLKLGSKFLFYIVTKVKCIMSIWIDKLDWWKQKRWNIFIYYGNSIKLIIKLANRNNNLFFSNSVSIFSIINLGKQLKNYRKRKCVKWLVLRHSRINFFLRVNAAYIDRILMIFSKTQTHTCN